MKKDSSDDEIASTVTCAISNEEHLSNKNSMPIIDPLGLTGRSFLIPTNKNR